MQDFEMAQNRKRGFASMEPEKQRAIAMRGGRAAHQQGTAHEFSVEEARVAGRKGGVSVSANRAHMAAIGKKGGQASRRGKTARVAAETTMSPSHANTATRSAAVGEPMMG